MGLPAARIGDMHECPMVTGEVPHVGGPICSGCMTVIIGGMPAARVGDMLICVGPIDVIATGATHVYIGGSLAARITDSTAHGGKIVMGCPTVLIEPGDSDSKDDPQDGDENNGGSNDDGSSDSATKAGNEDAAGPDGQSAQTSGQDAGVAPGSAGDSAATGDGQGGGAEGGGGAGGGGDSGGGAGGAGGADGDTTMRNTFAQADGNTLKVGVAADVGTPPPDLGANVGQALSGAAQGFGGAALDALKGVADLGQGAYQLATSQQARNDAYNNFQALQGAVGQAVQNPGRTATLTGQAVQTAANNFLQARQAAYDAGKGAEFDGKLFGRAAFEVASNVVPGAALHRVAEVANLRKATAAFDVAKNISEGAKAAGVSEATSAKLFQLAAEKDWVIKMRPTTPYAEDLLKAETHLPKSADLKMKTLSPPDLDIGAPLQGQLGDVPYFKPTRPDVNLAKSDPARWTAANRAYKARLEEYNELSKDMKDLQASGKIRLENGLVKDAETGKGFTGDNDIFDIHHADGTPLSPSEMNEAMARMGEKPIDAQHGGVMQWDTSLEPANKRALAERMKAQMIGAHTPYELGGAGKPLAIWGPSGYYPGFHIP